MLIRLVGILIIGCGGKRRVAVERDGIFARHTNRGGRSNTEKPLLRISCITGFSNKLCENLDIFRVRSSREDRNSSSIALHFLFSFFQSQFSYPIRGTSSRLLGHVHIIPLTFIEAQPTSTTIPDKLLRSVFPDMLQCSKR